MQHGRQEKRESPAGPAEKARVGGGRRKIDLYNNDIDPFSSFSSPRTTVIDHVCLCINDDDFIAGSPHTYFQK